MDESRVRALTALARATLTKADRHGRRRDAVVALLAAWFASKAAVTAVELPDDLVSAISGLRVAPEAARAAGRLALSVPLTGRTQHGAPTAQDGMTATRKVAVEEPELRAEYTVAAAVRLAEALGAGDLPDGVETEHRYLDQHVDAGRRRRAAAARLDAAARDARWLVWRTAGDDRVDEACRALENRIFPADDPPAIPGAVHPRCRCHAEPYGR